MKILPIIYPSALSYWRSHDPSGADPISLPRRYEIARDLGDGLYLERPIRAMAPDREHRITSRALGTSLRPKHLPAKSFYDEGGGIYVASPELCFLEAAGQLNLAELVKLGDTLCACYAPQSDSRYGQVRREPLTSAQDIAKFLARASGQDGVKRARQASRFVLDNAGSPMEVWLAVLAMLPMCLGGYGLPRPMLNYTIELSKAGVNELGRLSCRADMAWPYARVAAEYDSDLAHLDKEQHAYDKHRYNALRMSGYTVVVLTADHFKTAHAVDDTFLMLRRSLGLRTDMKAIVKYTEKRREVLAQLAS